MLSGLLFTSRRIISRLHRFAGSLCSRGLTGSLKRLRGQRPSPVRSGPDDALPACLEQQKPTGPVVLIVDASPPAPDRDSGSVRLSNIAHQLQARGYSTRFVSDDGFLQSAVDVPGLDGLPAPLAWLGRYGDSLHAAILCRHQIALPWIPLLRKLAPQARLIFDTVDLHHVREAREARHRQSRLLAMFARATLARERKAARLADETWVVSQDEQEQIRRVAPHAAVTVVSNSFPEVRDVAGFASRRDVLFVGGHRHPPNTDAAWWWLTSIHPLLHARMPDVVVHMVGGDVPDDLFEAACASPGVRMHGHVADLLPYLQGCRLAVAPLRFGAGVKGKIGLSMAHGQPVVTTACGAEGMHLVHGRDVLLADTPQAFADAVVRLYKDRAMWESLALAGSDNVRRHFSIEAMSRGLDACFPRVQRAAGD